MSCLIAFNIICSSILAYCMNNQYVELKKIQGNVLDAFKNGSPIIKCYFIIVLILFAFYLTLSIIFSCVLCSVI